MKFKKLKGESSIGRDFFPKGQKNLYETKEVEDLTAKYSEIDPSKIEKFEDMPISRRTMKGLKENNFSIPTEIQKESIILAFKGRDVLGAAKTGSGKTLAFLIPVLEGLYCKKWSNLDGLGALIITPTRELALQIYETLLKIGTYHEFSAGLIIGGKDLKFERNRMDQVNIIICTPGRLLQHMDENPVFDCMNMQILVLDEADRCLDLGFEKSMNAIIENLPAQRQTLLFSATQTKKVKDLGRLSLVNPEYIAVHEHEKFKTPDGLTQSYIICEQHEKMPILWSFIRSHPRQKIMIFLSTCNQVKYISEVFRKLRPKNPLFALQGKLHQLKRMDIYHAFCRKEHAVLFATDIAARGLDFPGVDWVVQADCPEDVDAYVHRVGRTARYTHSGESLLIISPTESVILEKLSNNRIPISEIKVNPDQIASPQTKLELFVTKCTDLKSAAQRAFVSYFKSVFLMKDKSVFNVKTIDTHQFARSLGLIAAPRVRFIQRLENKKVKSIQKPDDSDVDSGNEFIKKIDEIKNTSKDKKDFNFIEDGDSTDNESDMLVVKRRNHSIKPDEFGNISDMTATINKKPVVTTKAQIAKKILRLKSKPNKKVVFTEDGEEIINNRTERVSDRGGVSNATALDLDEAKKTMELEDIIDRKLYAQYGKERRLDKKIKEKGKKKEEKDKFDEEDSDDSGPDLSWLPDPDVIYRQDNDEPKGCQDNDGSKGIKRKREQPYVSEDDTDSESEDDIGLTLEEKEDLALKLISIK